MAVRVGYHCSHEQYAPGALLKLAQRAAAAGFECGMCSDHDFPWSEEEGESGFAWSWLGAAEFDAAGESIRQDEVAKKMRVSADPERHLDWLLADLELGFEEIDLHCVNRGAQERFIETFGERVLPELRKAG